MHKTRNLDAARYELVSARRLRAAFPLAAAAEPVANCRNTRRISIKQGSERQRQCPKPRETVKADGRAVSHGHDGNGRACQQPSRIIQREKTNPCEQVSDKQAGQCSDFPRRFRSSANSRWFVSGPSRFSRRFFSPRVPARNRQSLLRELSQSRRWARARSAAAKYIRPRLRLCLRSC